MSSCCGRESRKAPLWREPRSHRSLSTVASETRFTRGTEHLTSESGNRAHLGLRSEPRCARSEAGA